MLANFRLIRPHGQSHLCRVGDDVVLGSRLDVAHGDDRGIAGMNFAGDDGLQPHGDAGRDQYRINGRFRPRAVPAFAVDGDPQRIGIGLGIARRNADLAGCDSIFVMHGHTNVWFREFGKQPIIHHLSCAGDNLFRRLADQHESSVPGVFGLGHDSGGSE